MLIFNYTTKLIMMKFKNYFLLMILFVSVTDCKLRSTNADSVEAVETTVTKAAGQHKATVKVVLQTSVYSYLLVEENKETFWVACTKQDFSVDQVVYFTDGLAMENFESKELGKTFELVYFLNEVGFEPGSLQTPANASPVPYGMIQEAVKKEIKVEKAEGGITLGELFANPQSFKGKTVKIKGEVVKYNEAIMGKNWVHIQDGSGTGEAFDLTITTADVVKVGDVVTFTGVINLNKDFGAGYVYEVIMEEAKLEAQI